MALALVILICMILLTWYVYGTVTKAEHLQSGGWVRLYESPAQKSLAFEYTGPPGSYYKQMLRVNLKSIDVYLPPNGDKSDEIKRVEIWSMGGANNSSLVPGFYNSYLEPENEFRSNPAKYSMLYRILPGQHVQADLTEPVKKIMLMINF